MKKFGGQTLRIRVWQNKGRFHGRTHEAGDRMCTWEVMAEHGLFSYDIVANKRYRVRRSRAQCSQPFVTHGFMPHPPPPDLAPPCPIRVAFYSVRCS